MFTRHPRSRARRNGPTPRRAGFALIVVMLLMGMMAVAGLAVIDQVHTELELVGQERRIEDSQVIADGAVMEVINDERTPNLLPDYESTNLHATYTPPTDSPYAAAAYGTNYTAEIRLLRFVPVSESSQNWTRALVYEIDATGEVDHAHVSSEVRAQVFKTISVAAGVLLPRVHAR